MATIRTYPDGSYEWLWDNTPTAALARRACALRQAIARLVAPVERTNELEAPPNVVRELRMMLGEIEEVLSRESA